MIDKTLSGQPLGDEAKKNLARFRTMFLERQQAQHAEEQQQATLARKGVKVYSDEEKAAFLASRSDLA